MYFCFRSCSLALSLFSSNTNKKTQCALAVLSFARSQEDRIAYERERSAGTGESTAKRVTTCGRGLQGCRGLLSTLPNLMHSISNFTSPSEKSLQVHPRDFSLPGWISIFTERATAATTEVSTTKLARVRRSRCCDVRTRDQRDLQ